MRVEDTLVLYFVKWTLLVQHFTTVHVCIAYCKVCAHERSLEGLQSIKIIHYLNTQSKSGGHINCFVHETENE